MHVRDLYGTWPRRAPHRQCPVVETPPTRTRLAGHQPDNTNLRKPRELARLDKTTARFSFSGGALRVNHRFWNVPLPQPGPRSMRPTLG